MHQAATLVGTAALAVKEFTVNPLNKICFRAYLTL